MKQQSGITIPAKNVAEANSNCTCPPGESSGCGLECSTRPVFYCGQLLTDQDMNALVNWTRGKLRQSRYKDGWGVVNGLEIHCDPERPGWVLVEPGYAVSCCGDDIIVCEPSGLDLSGACQDEQDPCEQTRPQKKSQKTEVEAADVRGGAKILWGRMKEQIGKGEYPKTERDVRAVDLFIRYKETPSDAQVVLGSGACRQTEACEYSRAQESHELAWLPAALGSDPSRARVKQWLDNYAACTDLLQQAILEIHSYKKLANMGQSIKKFLLDKIKSGRLKQFCLVYDQICDREDEYFEVEKNLARILFFLVQDCRNHFLFCTPYVCQEPQGVRLARVYLEVVEDEKGRRSCKVMLVDPYPPFRRMLGLDCWPAYDGMVNLGQVIWHQVGEACRILSSAGLHIQRMEEFQIPNTLSELAKALDGQIMAGYNETTSVCGADLVLQYYQDENLGRRVVGFNAGYKETPRPLENLRLSKEGPPTTTLNAMFPYDFRIVNMTGHALTKLTILDHLPPGVSLVNVAGELGMNYLSDPSGNPYWNVERLDDGQALQWHFDVQPEKVQDSKLENYFTLSGYVDDKEQFQMDSNKVVTTVEAINTYRLAGRIAGLNAEHEAKLNQAGIRSVADLAGSNQAKLREIFTDPKITNSKLKAWILEANDMKEKGDRA